MYIDQILLALPYVMCYTLNMNIKQLIQLSPVPIEFVENMNNPSFAGVYYQGEAKGYTGKTCIEILDELDDNQKIATLIHEIAHAKCDTKNCECMKNSDHAKREIHAHKYTLKWLLKYKRKEILKQEMKSIVKQANGYACYEYYTKAAKHIMKLKLWQKCLDYIK